MYAVTQSEPGPPSVLTWSQVPTPEPTGDEVLIKIRSAGVNRADLLQRQGAYPPPPGAPDILGLECAGEIAALGPDADEWEVGDPCVALLAGGGYAEYVAVPQGQVVAPPEGVDPVSAGGLIEVAATVLSMTELAGLDSGDVFLVHGGAGGIGSFAIQYGRAVGTEVITTAGNADKLAYCRELGATHALDYHDDWVAGVAEATGGDGADVILDVIGAKYLSANLGAMAHDGRIAIIGLQGGSKAELDLNALLRKRGAVIAASLRSRPVDQKSAICAAVADDVWPLYADGAIRVPNETRIPMPEAARAHELLESGANTGKIVLTV
ncbi:NAD(P)H-quinone oxidoreductase [Naumannella huperziae]